MQPAGAVDVLFEPGEGVCAPPETALTEMDAAGIALAFVAPCNRLTCERQWACVDTRLEDVAKYLRASPRFAGMAGYNPFDLAESLREMEAARALGCRGTYVQLAAFGVPLDDRRFYPLYAKACELQQPVVVQGSGQEASAGAVRRVTRDFPELRLALAQAEPSAEMFALAGESEELAFVLDTPALALAARNCPTALEQLAERCVWGSNGAPAAASLEEARALPIAALPDILRTNALRYFAATAPDRLPRSFSRGITAAER